MDREKFRNVQKECKMWIEESVKKSTEKFLELEKQSAELNMKFNQCKAAISAIGDSQWSKRSFNFNYSAKSVNKVQHSDDIDYKPIDKKVKKNVDIDEGSQEKTLINLGFDLDEKGVSI